MVLAAPAPITSAPLLLEQRSRPEPGPGEVLLRVMACGLCRTNLHIVEGELPLVRTPIVPGHQVVGRVETVGRGVSRPARGDRVGVAWLRHTCGLCDFCRTGRENLCAQGEFTGYHADGGYAEYALAPANFAYDIPDVFDDVEAAPLLCAGIIGYRALRLSAVKPGQRLGIYGFGASAHLTAQVALARGGEVYVCTRRPSHQALARSLGATWVGDITARMPQPAHGLIIFAPAGELVPLALANLAAGGILALAGIYMSAIPQLDYDALYRERAIISVTANTRQDGREFLAEASRIPLRPEVTRFALEDANRALALLRDGGFAGAGVLVPGPG